MCSSVFQKKLPQNLKIEVNMIADATSYHKKAVISGGVQTTNFVYTIDNVLLYVWKEETFTSPPSGSEYVVDLKAVDLIKQNLAAAATSHDLSFNLKPSTHSIVVALQSSLAETGYVYTPTEFIVAGGIELALTAFRMQYAGQQYSNPQYSLEYTNATNTLYGYPLLHAQAIMNLDADIEQAGWMAFSEWFKDPVHHFKVVKAEDDRSTNLQVNFTTSAATADTNIIVYSEYSRACYIKYNADGMPSSVSVEDI